MNTHTCNIYNITTCTNYLTYIFMQREKQLMFLFQNYFYKKYIYQYLTNFQYCTKKLLNFYFPIFGMTHDLSDSYHLDISLFE